MRALALVCLLASLAAAAGDDGIHADAVTIVTARKSDWRIVSPSAAAPGADWASRELQRYLHQMSGCELPIGGRPGSKPVFVIGLRAKLSRADRALLPPPAPGYDGYALVVRPAAGKTPARIVIAGDNGRGVIYGVYDLLERLALISTLSGKANRDAI